MSSQYILATEFASFGLLETFTEAQARSASQLIDAHLGRPEGLVWAPDYVGGPAYMLGLSPSLTLLANGAFGPGKAVVVPYSGPVLDGNSVGEPLVLGKGTKATTETCVIQAVGPGFVTLASVALSHVDQTTMDMGLTIMEEKELPTDRSVTRASRGPTLRIVSGLGRYGYGRRSDQVAGNMQEYNLLAVVSNFGGPPLWIPWDPSVSSLNINSGEIWVPAGVLLAYFTDVKFWYLAGYQAGSIPSPVKQACANIMMNSKESGLGPNIRSRNVRDGTTVTKWDNNMIDANTRQMLKPYEVRRFV